MTSVQTPPTVDEVSDPPPRDPVPTVAARPRRGFLWGRLGVQSKLLAMLLVVSILSILVGGFFGYRSGSTALTEAAYSQLTSVRDARSRDVNTFFTGLQRSVILNSLNETATNAMTDLGRDFGELSDADVSAADQARIDGYYDKVFVPQLQENTGGQVTADAFKPTSTAARYLQANYTSRFTEFDEAVKSNDAGDGSTWSKDHARYHPYFREVVQRYGFEDAMLVDPDGNVVYTAYKGADLGTNLLTGYNRDSKLGNAFREVLRTNTVNAVDFTDFEPYTPSYDVPTAFGLSPVGVNGKLAGVLVVQLPVSTINDLMTTNQEWVEAGLGDSGEVFLVGPDHTMRSTSRRLLTDPEGYREAAVQNGTAPAIADEIVARKNPILLQAVNTPSVDLALRGQTGTITERDYLGRTVLTSYAPVTLQGVNWAVVAQIDRTEALRPVADFLRTLALSVLAVVLVVTLASVLLARAFSRPIQRLLAGVRRVGEGELGTQVEVRGSDEFADLATAFNGMSSSLATKQELLEAQMAQNDQMLRNLMPETVAKRYKEGEQNIVEQHTDVSVLYATLQGSEDLSIGRSPTESTALLNELVASFDQAAIKAGVDKVRVLRSGYIASCGLSVPRPDHALRTLDFAREIVAAVERFSNQHGGKLSVRVGIDSGSVTSGLVGPAVYDMWGDSVTLAYRAQNVGSTSGIYVTDRVYDKLRDAAEFAPAGAVATKQGERQVFQLEEADDA